MNEPAPPPSGPAYDLPPPPAVQSARDWQRLSPRMLLVHPVRMLGQFLVPLVIILFGASQGADGRWQMIGGGVAALLVVALGLVTWLTTRYRFTDTHLQIRRGWLSTKLKTARLDRVRAVDLESSLLHRLLDLSKVKVGTGVDQDQIELDGLSTAQAQGLQHYLLRRSEAAAPAVGSVDLDEAAWVRGVASPGGHGPAGAGAAGVSTELARIDWSWLRFAPFSLSSLVIVAGAAGVLSQLGDDLPIDQVGAAQRTWDWVLAQAVISLVGLALVALLIGWVALSTLNYVIQWWNLRLVRESAGTLVLSRGLFTTRSTSVEEAKIRGVKLGEPGLLRAVHGAELYTLATGTDSTPKVLPPCPRRTAVDVGHTVLEEDGALSLPVVGHGPNARRRMYVQRQWFTLAIGLGLIVPTVLLDLPWWLPLLGAVVVAVLAVLFAEIGWRTLGHALTERHLVSQHGALSREREVLERAGIIGWVLQESFFQRRLGLATLVATTAAGSERVTVRNVPVDLAVGLARGATPQMLAEFVR